MIVYNLDTNQSSGVSIIPLSEPETNLGTVLVCGNQVGGTYVGSIELTSQEDVTAFGMNGYGIIAGSLYFLHDIFFGAAITDLSPLHTLTTVTADIVIYNIQRNDLVGLDNLTTINGTLDVRPYILAMGDPDTNYMINFKGLEGVVHVGEINIEGLEGNNITSLEGLENVLSVDNGISIYENQNLSDFCALQNVFINGTYGGINITNNSYNPTVQDIIDGNCSN